MTTLEKLRQAIAIGLCDRAKPILFSPLMVQALLAGRKTQTRRIIKSRHESGRFQICRNNQGIVTSINSLDWNERNCEKDITPKYKVGDTLWVKEAHWNFGCWNVLENGKKMFIHACADFENCTSFEEKQLNDPAPLSMKYLNINAEDGRWYKRPSIFMFAETARIFLKVTKVRVERACDISEADAIAEGIEPLPQFTNGEIFAYRSYAVPLEKCTGIAPYVSFRTLWDSINGSDTWNNWVFVYDFEIIEKPNL